MPVVSESMMLDKVNRADVSIGHVKRQDVFAEHANFRVAHILVFNSREELLLQRLALSRKRNPGAWGSSVASYLFASESYEHAARRRLREELGIAPTDLSVVGKTTMMDEGCLKFISIFAAKNDGPFTVDRNHVEEVQFVRLDLIAQMIETDSRPFTPTFHHVFQFYVSQQR